MKDNVTIMATLIALFASIATVLIVFIVMFYSHSIARDTAFVEAGYARCHVDTPGYGDKSLWVMPENCPFGQIVRTNP